MTVGLSPYTPRTGGDSLIVQILFEKAMVWDKHILIIIWSYPIGYCTISN